MKICKVPISNKISTWLAILGAIPLAVGGITKGIDLLRYDLLNKAHNDEEIYTRHMIADHLQTSETVKTTTLLVNGGYLVINIYKDKCVVVKRETEDGMVIKNTVLPDPEKAEKIKNMYSNSGNLAYAMSPPFDFGHHRKDYGYEEKKKGAMIYRIYRDECVLSYSYDNYGNTINWRWEVYRH